MLNVRWLIVCLFLCLGTSLTVAQTLVDLRTQTKTVDFSGANATKPFKSGVVLPSTCQVGEMFYNTAAVAGANLYGCTALNSWTIQSGTILPSVFQNGGKVLSTDGTNFTWSSPGGDLSGSLSAATVIKLQGRPVASTVPATGQFLGWNSSTSTWQPMTPASSNIPGVSGNSGKFFTTDGTSLLWSNPSGDVSGTISAISVTGLQGHAVSTAQPTSGQVLGWNSSTSRWEPQTVTSGSGGASTAAQLGDFAVVKTSSTVLTVGANCSTSVPCNVRFGSSTYTFTAGATVNLNGGTGIAYIYVSSSGSLTVGHNLNITCASGCSSQSGVTGFPASSIPIWLWSSNNGSWDAVGMDARAMLATKNIVAGTGIMATDQMGQTLIALDPTVASLQVATPATSTTACAQGSWATDTAFYYLCTSNNVWKRVALSSW